MEKLTIKEGMWKECLDYAVKAQSHFTLLKIAEEGTSENNQAEIRRLDKTLRKNLVKLSTKYQCDLSQLRILISHLVEILQLIPAEKLEEYDPIGKSFGSTGYYKWISEMKL